MPTPRPARPSASHVLKCAPRTVILAVSRHTFPRGSSSKRVPPFGFSLKVEFTGCLPCDVKPVGMPLRCVAVSPGPCSATAPLHSTGLVASPARLSATQRQKPRLCCSSQDLPEGSPLPDKYWGLSVCGTCACTLAQADPASEFSFQDCWHQGHLSSGPASGWAGFS